MAQQFVQTLLAILLLAPGHKLYAQDSLGNHYLTLSSAFRLALANSTEMALVHRTVTATHQQAVISRQARQPGVSAGLSGGYLSNSDIWKPGFNDHRVSQLPHVATSFSVAASWTVIAGGRIKLVIQQADLQEDLAVLSVDQQQEEVKLLVALKYLDICRQLNQRQIYLDNARLAQHRLSEIQSMYRQGTVTRNDVLRTQIELNDYELAARQTGDAVIRLNTELDIVFGQPDSIRLIPDSTGIHQAVGLRPLGFYLAAALNDNPRLLIARTESRSAALRVDQQKAERLPVISLFGGSNLQRPYVYSIPAADIYYNVWSAGISIQYDIASLYHSPVRIKGSRLDLDVSRTRDTLTEQQVTVGVRNAYNLCLESWDQLETARKDVAYADENYRIVEEQYRNQLALITNLIDAADTKIEAEIKVNDAVINTIYTYYQLLQLTGSL
jgi:outer membrane protein